MVTRTWTRVALYITAAANFYAAAVTGHLLFVLAGAAAALAAALNTRR